MKALIYALVAVLAGGLLVSSVAAAQVGEGGALGRLTLPLEGGLAHYSSYDRTGGNADWLTVGPGETYTLVDHEGAGVVRRWWITLAPRNNRDARAAGYSDGYLVGIDGFTVR